MYKLPDGQINIYSFVHPLEDMLDPANRWVVRSKSIPWEELELHLAARLYSTRGAPAKAVRMMLGAMMIADELGLTDAETVRQIEENPYMQYFVGYHEFTRRRPFTPLSLTLFRKRITPPVAREIRRIVKKPRNTEASDV